jgi:hypothetical protein
LQKKKKEIKSGVLRLVLNSKTNAADSLAYSKLAVDVDSLAAQEANPVLVPDVSPGSAGT